MVIPLLALQIHTIQQLLLHIPLGNGTCQLHHAVGQGTLAVVDMGDDAEITDMFHTLAFPVPAKINSPKEDLPQPIKHWLGLFKP